MRAVVVIATLNEAANVGALIPEIRRYLPDAAILVVDDNSPDGTADVVRRLGEADPLVSVICRTDGRGYGSAMVAGLQHAVNSGYDAVLTLDADFSHDPSDLPRLLAALSEADVSIGSRYIGGVRVLNWEVRRLLLSLGANTYIRLLSGLPCFDCTSGFRGYRAEVFRSIDLNRIRVSGYAFLPELLFALGSVKVKEVPVCYTERRLGQSKMSKRVMVEAAFRPWGLLIRRALRPGQRASSS